MADYERDEILMLSASREQNSANHEDPRYGALTSRTQSASMSIPSNSNDSYQNQTFSTMSGPILDAVCEKLRQKTYIKGSKILNRDGLIKKMVFIVRGKMQSEVEDGVTDLLSEGDACGEELLAWCLENSSGHRLHSNRTVQCLTNVEAFALRADDLEQVTSLFARFLRNPRVQGAIRLAYHME